MLKLILRTAQFTMAHVVVSVVDRRINRLPRKSDPPEVMRLLLENLALKAQLSALRCELKIKKGKRPRVSLQTRLSQVFAYLLTRDNMTFQKYHLTASRHTLQSWLGRFRRWPWSKKQQRKGGRPPISEEIVELIVRLKTENPLWGARKVCDTLLLMGIKVSKETIRRIFIEQGFDPHGPRRNWDRFQSAARDAKWAMDYFFIRTVKGGWLSVLLVIDIYSRELMELRAYDGWEVDSAWTMKTVNECMNREDRKPAEIVHDRGTVFKAQFERQLRVLGIEQTRIPPGLPSVNGIAERTIYSVKSEILNHVKIQDVEELQWYLDQYREYFNGYRAHQALNGSTPTAFGNETPAADVIDLETMRQKRLICRSFAHGLLNGYELVDKDQPPAKAA